MGAGIECRAPIMVKKPLLHFRDVFRGEVTFTDRVDESPLRYENFGASRSKKSLFVSEIRPF